MHDLDRSTIWPYVDAEPQRFYYSRYDNPTVAAAEEELGALEGGEALLFPSGAGATTALVLQLLQPGDTIALAEGCYFGTSGTFKTLAKWGVRYVEFDQTGRPPDGVQLVWLEAPSNPFLTMPDLDAAARHPARVLVDSTASTPVYLRPLERGADYVLHSATKYLTGHHDALLGATVTRDPGKRERLYTARLRLGLSASPDAAAALLRGLDTLEVRVPHQTASATELARRLEAHPAVLRVRYPGFGGVISFDVEGDDVRRVETSTSLIANMTSLGGVRSSMESRHRWEGDRIPRGLLRLSVGLEPVEELWADLAAALERQ